SSASHRRSSSLRERGRIVRSNLSPADDVRHSQGGSDHPEQKAEDRLARDDVAKSAAQGGGSSDAEAGRADHEGHHVRQPGRKHSARKERHKEEVGRKPTKQLV